MDVIDALLNLSAWIAADPEVAAILIIMLVWLLGVVGFALRLLFTYVTIHQAGRKG